MNLWPQIFCVAGLASAAYAQQPQEVGEVLTVKGTWCRQGMDLKARDSVFLKDDIRYCTTPIGASDEIVIRFSTILKSTPYDRPYKCSTPGICDKKEKLWLEGAYLRIHTPSGGPLISSPRTYALAPDHIFETGEHWATPKVPSRPTIGVFDHLPTSGRTSSALSGSASTSAVICRVDGGQIEFCADGASGFDAYTPGLYAIFNDNDRTNPTALIGVVLPKSDAEFKWTEVPEAFKLDNSADTVAERRLYIMNLLNNAKP